MADPVVTTGAVAVGAFLLATAREEYNRNRERRQKDSAVLGAIVEEVAANLSTASNNRELVRTELESLDREGKKILNPLDPLELGFWDLVKLQPPAGLVRDKAAFASVREVARLAAQVNQMLQSREAFRIASTSGPTFQNTRGMATWTFTLRAYDELLVTFLDELIDALNKLQPAVKAWRRHT